MIHWPQSFGGKVKLCPRFYIDKGQFADKVYRIVTDGVVINRNSKFIQTHLTRVRRYWYNLGLSYLAVEGGRKTVQNL